MTINATQTGTTNVYSGFGGIPPVDFPITFLFGKTSQVMVYQRDTLTAQEELLKEGLDYTIRGGQTSDASGVTSWSDGTLTLLVTLLPTDELHIIRSAILTQQGDYNQTNIIESTHESNFDALTLRDQSTLDEAENGIRYPANDVFVPTRDPVSTLPQASARANLFLGFDSNGDVEAQAQNAMVVPSAHMDEFIAEEGAAGAKESLDIADSADLDAVLNPGFEIDQRQGDYSAIADAAYHVDGWYWLSQEAGKYGITQETRTSSLGSRKFLRIECNETGISRKFIVIQIIPSWIVDEMRQWGTATLGVNARIGDASHTSMAVMDMQLLEFSDFATEDTMVQDIVSAWNGVANPTWQTFWSYNGTSTGIRALSSSWQQYGNTVSISPGGGIHNVAIVIGKFGLFGGQTSTIGHQMDLAEVTLVPGNDVAAFRNRGFSCELNRCEPRYWKSFPYATEPVQTGGVDGALHTSSTGSNRFVFDVRLNRSMIFAPSVVTYNPSAAASSARNLRTGGPATISVSAQGEGGFVLTPDVPVGLADDPFAVHATAEANPHA